MHRISNQRTACEGGRVCGDKSFGSLGRTSRVSRAPVRRSKRKSRASSVNSEIRKPETNSHERISPTAWSLAYRRSLTDIPYSSGIFEELRKILRRTRSAAEIQELDELVRPEITPMFEARFKLMNRLLRQRSARQILEIAAGFSPRSMDFARDSSVEYAEMDLPGMIKEKRAVVEELIKQSKIPRYPNVHFYSGDALNPEDLLAATKLFRNEPIAVVNEGLLRYLSFGEKAIVAQNVHKLLERFGGVWMTPDLSVRPEGTLGLPEEKMKELNDRIERITGIEIGKNYFENEGAARAFFENIGFAIERHGFLEAASELVSPQKLGLTPVQVEKGLKGHAVFVMTLD